MKLSNLIINEKTNKLLGLPENHIILHNNTALQTTITSTELSIENTERSEII